MPNRDIRSNLLPKLILNDSITGNGNTDSGDIDVADYDGGVKFNIYASAYTDGDHAIQIHESDTAAFTPDSTTLVSGDALIPQSAALTISAATAKGDVIASIGYIGAKRYAKIRVVSTSVTTGATLVVTLEASPEIKQDPNLV